MLMFFAYKSSGQVINGSVTDRDEEIPFVQINLFRDSSLIAKTTSDVNGKFQFKNVGSGNFKLITEYVGCKADTTKLKLSNDKEFNIKIEMICQGIECWEEPATPTKKIKANNNKSTSRPKRKADSPK